MSGPIDSVYPDSSPVQKTFVRSDDKTAKRRNMESVNAVQNTDLSGQFAGIHVQELHADFYLDTSDTTSAPNGTTILKDLAGNLFKITRASAIYLLSGGLIDFDFGGVTIEHATDSLSFSGAVNGYTFSHALKPIANDGAALGSSTLKWSDLFLASGAVINFNSGDVAITHSSNEIAVSGGRLRLGSVAADPFAQTFQTDNLIINNAGGASSFLMRASAGGTDSKLMDFALSAGIYEQRFLNDAFSLAGPIFQSTRSGYQVTQTSYFANAVEQFRLTPSHAYFPAIGTTASAANAFLNSGSSPVNELLRSTSSLAYKRDVEPLEEQYADRVLALEPIWYRSKASNDNPDWSWYGLGAEDVAAIDPRLVHWGYQDDDFDIVERERVETIERRVEMEVDGKTVIETVPHEIRTVTHERVLKEGVRLKPDGVMYDRVAVLLLDVVKRLEARVSALEAQIHGPAQISAID